MISKNYPASVRAVATNSINQVNNQADDSEQSTSNSLQQNRPLRLTISVDNPSFLKVRVGQEIKQGDVISDNSVDRGRLEKKKKSVVLQINNLKSKIIPEPPPPPQTPPLRKLPPAVFSEEESAIAQAQMRLSQAQAVMSARTPLLNADNPEHRAEAEKAEAALRAASQKVEEHQQLLQSMQDMRLETAIVRHESAKLKQLQEEEQQATSTLDSSRAKLNASAINQQQELQSLELGVRMQFAEVELAKSRLIAAKNRRGQTEYEASVHDVERSQRVSQLALEYSRQQQIYSQSIRDRDYQLAQLSLSLAAIDEKLGQIPVVKSPKAGYIRRVKPWVGNNGKYTTTVTISSTSSSNSSSGAGTNTTANTTVPGATRR